MQVRVMRACTANDDGMPCVLILCMVQCTGLLKKRKVRYSVLQSNEGEREGEREGGRRTHTAPREREEGGEREPSER